MQVYDRLYDVVAENYQAAGREFGYKKNTFLCDVEKHPRVIDVSGYLHLDNVDFLPAIFVAVFKRLPEEKELTCWESRYSQAKEQFQEAVLRSIAGSGVAAINRIELVNNPYFEQKKGFKYRMLGKLYGLTDKSSLREFGKKLPMPIQKIIRKVFL